MLKSLTTWTRVCCGLACLGMFLLATEGADAGYRRYRHRHHACHSAPVYYDNSGCGNACGNACTGWGNDACSGAMPCGSCQGGACPGNAGDMNACPTGGCGTVQPGTTYHQPDSAATEPPQEYQTAKPVTDYNSQPESRQAAPTPAPAIQNMPNAPAPAPAAPQALDNATQVPPPAPAVPAAPTTDSVVPADTK